MTHPFLAFPTDAVKTARRQPALAGLLSSTSLWTLSGLALVACGGGGHTDQPVRIQIYDGPVAGAKWGYDVDGDGILDPDEVQGRTDATGYIETGYRNICQNSRCWQMWPGPLIWAAIWMTAVMTGCWQRYGVPRSAQDYLALYRAAGAYVRTARPC